jgi:hypothetical protein
LSKRGGDYNIGLAGMDNENMIDAVTFRDGNMKNFNQVSYHKEKRASSDDDETKDPV